MKTRVRDAVIRAHERAVEERGLSETELPAGFQITVPRQEAHGDFSTNLAMILASKAGISPRHVADTLKSILRQDPLFERVEVAGPGFLNLFISTRTWQQNLVRIFRAGRDYGRTETGNGKRVLVEFVSANPTGPLHVGHGRGAAVGDSLARILRTAGFAVETEYYINDVGNQMRTLGSSVYLRYLELFGRRVEFPGEYYQGDYIREIAKAICDREGARYLDVPVEECWPHFTKEAVEAISAGIRKDLQDFDVYFDNWFSERSLHESGMVEKALSILEGKGLVYEKDGALWFKSSGFGDEKDRVVRRSTGELTYFASDIAYHLQKIQRGYDLLVDIWGADHHGYVARVRAAIKALGKEEDSLKVLLVQLVNLIEGGQQKAMSTRAGEFVTLREVMDDVGKDAARFMFLTRRCDSHLDFDLDLARSQGQENPVYYVQYAHARLASVFRKAQDQGVALRDPDEIDTSLLDSPEELKLLKILDAFPQVVAESALALEPHRISYYLTDLAGRFHGYYTRCRFLGEDPGLTQARLLLAAAMKEVFRKGLNLLGVSAPDTM